MTVDETDTTVGDWEREPDPSDSLRTFGAVVQALREHAGITREEFGARVRYSKHTVASVELGRRMPDPAFVERAEELLGNTGALRKAARHLTRSEPGLAVWFRRWARLERAAVSLCTYECRLVPGLLQSEGYMRVLCDDDIPPMTDNDVETTVRARLERQLLLVERPHTIFDFIVEEAVFARCLGGLGVTRELLDHVLSSIARRNVVLQVMPMQSEHHACMAGPIQLLEAADGQRRAYVEGQESGRLIADRKEVGKLSLRYARLRSQALSPKDSLGLLERMRGGL
ncbi:helix-turn-helix transcriptional regulator [Streptomyces sp. NPDC005953]|uniref:helix-turn-helix domain-containing protein n=1 Tax=Streptomyces sp. NPDC005953 TaxID=3156719 RepID=UPI0033CDB713